MEAVLRLLPSEQLDALSHELRVTASRLARWWDRFLASGEAALKSRKAHAETDEIRRLRTKIGEITMENELLYDKIHGMEANLPPPSCGGRGDEPDQLVGADLIEREAGSRRAVCGR